MDSNFKPIYHANGDIHGYTNGDCIYHANTTADQHTDYFSVEYPYRNPNVGFSVPTGTQQSPDPNAPADDGRGADE